MSRIRVDVRLKRDGFVLDCDLDIPEQGVTAILGPSGSGKTTLLRVIAGLETPDQGSITVGDKVWVNTGNRKFLSSQKRKVGMVFQDYALFEHLTVAQNIGYGLPRRQRGQLVDKWINRLHLESLEGRYPHELSGGQKQRVALARALATEPDILLLDEPFSAVDVSLREKLRRQLQEIVKTLEQPVLIVTHDLEEVHHLADRIGVMVDGRLSRIGQSNNVFDDPGNYEVAKILGWRNFLPVKSITSTAVTGAWGELSLEQAIPVDTDWLSIRPYHIRLTTEEPGGLCTEVVHVRELGAVREMECRLRDGTRLVMQSSWHEPLPAPGSQVWLKLPLQHIQVLCDSPLVQIRQSGNTTARLADRSVDQFTRGKRVVPMEKQS